MAYTNGRLPDSILASITGMAGARLRSGPAAAWEQLRQAVFAAYGWYPAPTGISDAYRSHAVQEATFRARYQTSYVQYATGKVDRRVWNGVAYYRKPGTAAAAVPAPRTTARNRRRHHRTGWFRRDPLKQLSAIAVPLDWSNTEGRSVGEAWHWTYTGPAEATSNDTAITGAVPAAPDLIAPDPIEEDPMSAAESVALLTQIVAKLDTTTEIIGVPIQDTPLDKSKGQHFYLVNWANGTKLHLNSRALAYHRARGQLDIIEWQPTGTLAGLVLIK
ncbi:hypothetical protein [Cellulomonas denverensis]|uniref:hypothetical protein n=1 Tax=Cellulomonas denverensis TaxID=264297 RepID=UPI0035EB899D